MDGAVVERSRRVIIPAAGRGNRLRPLTDTIPKPLVELDGKPLLQHSLEKLGSTGRVSEVVLVVGHMRDTIREAVERWSPPFPVHFVDNLEYDHTNSLQSLWLTERWWTEGFVLLDSDIYYDKRLLQPLFEAREDVMVVDGSRKWSEIDMKVTVRDGHIWHLDKGLGPDETHGEFFGMSYFTRRGAHLLRSEMEAYVARGETNVWYEFAVREVAKKHPISPVPTHHDAWREIDCESDLRAAELWIARGNHGPGGSSVLRPSDAADEPPPVAPQADIFRSIRSIDAEAWDRVTGGADVTRMHGFLTALEEVVIGDLERRYIVWRDARGAMIAHSFFYAVTVPIDILLPHQHPIATALRWARRVYPAFLSLRTVGCGPPTTLGHTLTFADPVTPEERSVILRGLVAAMAAFAREHGASCLMIRDLRREDAAIATALIAEGFRRMPNLEDTAIEVRWKSFEAYLASLKARYRKLILEQIEQADRAGVRRVRVTSWGHLADDMARLFQATAQRHTAGPVVGADYFRNLSDAMPGRIGATLFWMEERLVGFILYFLDPTTLTPTYLGVDYEANVQAALIFNAYFDVIRVAIETGKSRIRFGRSAYVAKLRLGAEIEPLDMFGRFQSGFVTDLAARVMQRLVPRQPLAKWSVWKGPERRSKRPTGAPS